MMVARTSEEVRALIGSARRADRSAALVPTMGSLHEGHLSLVARARELADVVVLTVFVNPTQFGPGEDLERYPRDLERDTRLARDCGVDILYLPVLEEVYPAGHATYVVVEGVSDVLCGRSRPGHFRGVATIVTKLLVIVEPGWLVLGQKDAQQVIVLRRAVRDLCLPVEVVTGATMREPDGLAMSSRNVYLGREERSAATVLHRALGAATQAWHAGERRGSELVLVLRQILDAEPRARVEYAVVVDPETLREVAEADRGALCLLAVHIGSTRLIDNVVLTVDEA